jgi:putative two-component system response regulator
MQSTAAEHSDNAVPRPAHVRANVLVVDDDAQIRDLLVRLLQTGGHSCVSVPTVAAADGLLEQHSFDAVLCDLHMPGESGLDLVSRIATEHPATAVVMVSGHDDRSLVETALEVGVYGYVTKPFKPSDILIGVTNALHRRDLEEENRAYRDSLEVLVGERTAALQTAAGQLERTATEIARSREQTIRRLSRAVEYRDEATGGHVERVSQYCELLAQRLGLDGEQMRMASPMHDVGKIAVRDAVLLKPGRLTPAERIEMERHCDVGYDILQGSGSTLLDLAATIALTHHERVDGTGYPRRLSGDDIPFEGRIAAVADVFDALTSDRVYRAALDADPALEIMCAGRDTQFDPVVLDMFVQSMDDVLTIRQRFAD